MNYRSLADLNRVIRQMKIPPVDVIAGIPRSGMLAASLLALHHNLPLTDLRGLAEGRTMGCGTRGRPPAALRSALVIDDSILSGRTMGAAERLLAGGTVQIYYAAVFAEPRTQHVVDIYGELLPRPRLFEWNILHHAILARSCMDIDGILCPDPTSAQNDDGPRYQEFIRTTPPLYAPSVPIGWLVTNRLEKYRTLTEAWLKAAGVNYKELIMLDLPDKAARLAQRASYAQHKAAAYKKTGARLFLESSRRQAQAIARLTAKSVFCIEDWRMYGN